MSYTGKFSFLERGRGWRLSVVFVVVVNLTLPLRLTKSLLFRSQGSLSHYEVEVVGSLIQHQSLTNAIGEVVYDLDKGIQKLEVFPTILGHYDDFSHGGAMTDRQTDQTHRGITVHRVQSLVYQILMVLFLHSYKRGYKKPNYT